MAASTGRPSLWLAAAGAVVTLAALVWFAIGPGGGQLAGIRTVTPILAVMVAIGQWRISRDRRLPESSARFWMILSLAMFTYTGGMVIDLVALAVDLPGPVTLAEFGEMILYPIAALFTAVSLVVFPTRSRGPEERIKIGLDVAIVLFATATFVWYFFASPRWTPQDGWQKLSNGLVLPALTVVAGFTVLRIALAGVQVVGRRTVACFMFGVASETVSIFINAKSDTALGRFGNALQAVGLAACVLGVVLQGGSRPPRPTSAPVGWRRPFTVLPYVALGSTVALLVLIIHTGLGLSGWVLALGVIASSAAVIARQMLSLWENARLLAANRALTDRLAHRAYHDHLTGLANRSLFGRRVTDALAGRGGDPVAVLLIDLDDFKLVNDSLGHQVGDELLAAVADRLRATIAAEDTLARLGGDEFAVLVTRPLTEVSDLAARIVTALAGPFQLSGPQAVVRASVGVAVAAPDVTCADLLRHADVAMYAAKHGRLGWRLFEPGMLAGHTRRLGLRGALAGAVDRGELDVHFRPIVELATGCVRGAEALVRWWPDGSLCSPLEFGAVAQQTGLLADVDRLMLRQACRLAARWLTSRPSISDRFVVYVRVGQARLMSPELAVDVSRALADHELPADRLTLVISGSGLEPDPLGQTLAERLAVLAALGVRLALEGFGTGYSSVACLSRLPLHVLKIDRVLTGTAGAPLARAVVLLAAALHMQTVAEGVDGPAQVGPLLALGCRYGQGAHFGDGLTAEELLVRGDVPAHPNPSI